MKKLKFAPVGRVAPEILRQPALETGPAKLYEWLAMRVCCAADRAAGELTCGIQQRR
jgi:hypothetical protein